MVMNKKGFLKILEAIIAIVIVFGFVIAIIPNKPQTTSRIPPDLEQTTNSLLEEMQSNAIFRQCVLNGTISYDFDNDPATPGESVSSVECVNRYLDLLSYPTQSHPWNYSVKICKVNITGSTNYCDYSPPLINGLPEDIIEDINAALPKDKDIYTRSITLTVPDVAGEDTPPADLGNYSVLTVFAWSK